MCTGKQTSTAALMWLIVLVAFELVLFQEVWFIVLVPPITIGVLAINLGFLFLMVRPKLLETRIIGMLLGGVAASFVTVAGMVAGTGILNDLRNALVNWAASPLENQGLTVKFVRFVAENLVVVGYALLDLLGVAVIWAGGRLENRWRRRRAHARPPSPAAIPPLDECAASPL